MSSQELTYVVRTFPGAAGHEVDLPEMDPA